MEHYCCLKNSFDELRKKINLGFFMFSPLSRFFTIIKYSNLKKHGIFQLILIIAFLNHLDTLQALLVLKQVKYPNEKMCIVYWLPYVLYVKVIVRESLHIRLLKQREILVGSDNKFFQLSMSFYCSVYCSVFPPLL